MATFSRLIRFLAQDGRIYYGDAILPSNGSNINAATHARLITNGTPFDPLHAPSPSQPTPPYTITTRTLPVARLLCPLTAHTTRTIRCLGLNYAAHARESRMPLPVHPVLFYKPVTALNDPTAAIPVPRMAQETDDDGGASPRIDYEAELAIIIGRRARDVAPSAALSYVAGFAVANDVSQRTWQLSRGGGQWGLGKGFDGWAPLGPGIASSEALILGGGKKDPDRDGGLGIRTEVNGVEVQASGTGDMVFGVRETVSFLSRGTTLLPGDVILTGTPQGVGMGRAPPLWLKDGDVVEVNLEGVGSCVNKIEFERDETTPL
ncbi:Fumarylacetoacetase [Macrophomina phaseolina MS6]|uniref:Fumarylacetoacetase n=1 Tax=Macrophomina phaseolina (strain MS6) TaxID=1126212 RepID=K2QYG8_MACPH|nr:Fumarylacetoacetase [Macrophomina phaseolina MS6]